MMSSFANLGRESVLPLVIERYADGRFSIDELVDVYRSHVPRIRLFPGYSGLLRSLKRNHRLGIITDGHPEVQRRKAEALGLPLVVDSIVYTWELGSHNEKPHPLPFTLMLERLNVEPRRALFIGDSLYKDRRGAQGVGMKFARVLATPRPAEVSNSESEPVLDTLHRLPLLLQSFRG
jgi:putative hydrolase of the HAD superfamily